MAEQNFNRLVTQVTPSNTLTIATYNIHACIGSDGQFDPARIAAVLQELDADIIALQEVEHHSIDELDLLEYLAYQTGHEALAGPTLFRETRHYGNALLTRLPLRSFKHIDLSFSGCEPRGAIEATFDVAGYELQVIATHLGLKPAERRWQVKQLLEIKSQQEADISCLLGDVNEWLLWGRPLRWLHQHFSAQPHLPTFPAGWPVFALDRIWISPQRCQIKLSVHKTALARQASDHLPLVVKMRF
ncbi:MULTISPECIES: endonuclease/exonuclease/phosphatase family protein [unclassified Methylophaga]|jgi:endonuclease/exonuclease/phosphatase family metal-dependent hydrolase|uniref:endonuclease/exonuclease/phosphatase family protein n=2 Tax=Methylophaga TaxID=40222 RepID=UPI000C903D1D|nr:MULTISPECIES: endonuclease/exonuclease/phosphatase family protein [unclassified Methylophaga]MAK66099.1 endonuclease [Methylophaga sp.]MAY17295.1 endonuclease [Methylophaga sp.]MBN45725.1 endonuclease [Methylophaga sp.]HCD06030.1 endonuclease [Methylophaga sp.]|tara:strand:- start:25216 stop:25950 length:735 start_codon:yes stop_codon:yes gene_type:complete